MNEYRTIRRASPAMMDKLWAEGWRHFGTHFFRYSSSLLEGQPWLLLRQAIVLRLQEAVSRRGVSGLALDAISAAPRDGLTTYEWQAKQIPRRSRRGSPADRDWPFCPEENGEPYFADNSGSRRGSHPAPAPQEGDTQVSSVRFTTPNPWNTYRGQVRTRRTLLHYLAAPT